jgi:hypothetical protein
MLTAKEDLWKVVKNVAPGAGFDPYLVMAVCEQESAKDKKQSEKYRPDIARLEQGFYGKYVEPRNDSTAVEVMLSASYGVMQTMGLILVELGYFQWWFEQGIQERRTALISPLSNAAVARALDEYCVNLEWQVQRGVQHLQKKRTQAAGNIERMLLNWNGGAKKTYPAEVLEKCERLKKELCL